MYKTQWYHFYNELQIRFGTDHAAFFDFVEQAHGLQKGETKSGKPDLDVRVYFHEKNTLSLKKKLAHNVFFDEGEILYLDRGFSVHAKQGKQLSITAHVWNEPVRDLYHIVRFGRQGAQRGKYLEVMRKSLLLPLFYLLEKEGYLLLHGSAVLGTKKSKENNIEKDEVFVFLGANYVGKTTAALNLIWNHGFGLISDNYILVKNNIIYPFPDQMRGTKYILDVLSIKVSGQAVSDKYLIKLESIKKITSPCAPTKTFFMQLGPEPQIKPIDFADALNRLNAFHNYLGEFPEYSYLAFFPDFPSVQDLQRRVCDFLRKPGLELFEFQSGPDVKKNTELLLRDLT